MIQEYSYFKMEFENLFKQPKMETEDYGDYNLDEDDLDLDE